MLCFYGFAESEGVPASESTETVTGRCATATDQSEDSDADIMLSVTVPVSQGRDGRWPPLKRKQPDVDDGDDTADDRRPWIENTPDWSRSPILNKDIVATTTVLTMRMSVITDSDGENAAAESVRASLAPSDLGLRLFRDIRDVDKILSLSQRHGESSSLSPSQRHEDPPSLVPETQPLDLTSHRRKRPDMAANARATSVIVKPVSATKTKRAKAVQTMPVSSAVFDPDTASKIGQDIATKLRPITAAMSITSDTTTTTAAAAADTAPVANKGTGLKGYRRKMANARERNRTQTVSDAYENLRTFLPVFSNDQRLSKLATVRVASTYILTLSRMLGADYSAEQDGPSVDECIRRITRILKREDKPPTIRRRDFSTQ